MAKIYQKFDLDLNSVAKLRELSEESRKKLTELNFPKAAKTLMQKLLEKGYEVLESDDIYYGLHGSIILGGELGRSHKKDFYGLAAELNLPYRSGHSYQGPSIEADTSP